jgi:hypothetical protein
MTVKKLEEPARKITFEIGPGWGKESLIKL